MNILILYESSQTFTNTVYDHLESFGLHSIHRVFYVHANQSALLDVNLGLFDAVGIHYSVRLPFDQISPSVSLAFENFNGLKFLFIQDEYDYTKRAWYWIKTLGFQLVFTVVPEEGIERVYPKSEFPNTRFVSNLTGYAPDLSVISRDLTPPSERGVVIGYRARSLPIRYGWLGFEKISIGMVVKNYCDDLGVVSDIAWTEHERIYGDAWPKFVRSCRSMLGSESGSNVFDWDGNLNDIIEQYQIENNNASDDEVYRNVICSNEIDGLMNQVSPRIFEAISNKTVLVLYEGNYSGVVLPGVHFIALKKDGSNLKEVVCKLQDGDFVDAMAERAFNDVIATGKYSYRNFVSMVDIEWGRAYNALGSISRPYVGSNQSKSTHITTWPIRAKPWTPITTVGLAEVFWGSGSFTDLTKRLAHYFWFKIPDSLKLFLKPFIKRVIRKG